MCMLCIQRQDKISKSTFILSFQCSVSEILTYEFSTLLFLASHLSVSLRVRETKLATKNTWTSRGHSSVCHLANLRDRTWRSIVFCLVDPRSLRFLACNTSPSISSSWWTLLGCLRAGMPLTKHLHWTSFQHPM